MGQKTHPYGFRLGIIKTWHSRWYYEKEYAPQLQEDLRIRGFVKARLNHAGVSSIEIERRSIRNQRDRVKIGILLLADVHQIA